MDFIFGPIQSNPSDSQITGTGFSPSSGEDGDGAAFQDALEGAELEQESLTPKPTPDQQGQDLEEKSALASEVAPNLVTDDQDREVGPLDVVLNAPEPVVGANEPAIPNDALAGDAEETPFGAQFFEVAKSASSLLAPKDTQPFNTAPNQAPIHVTSNEVPLAAEKSQVLTPLSDSEEAPLLDLQHTGNDAQKAPAPQTDIAPIVVPQDTSKENTSDNVVPTPVVEDMAKSTTDETQPVVSQDASGDVKTTQPLQSEQVAQGEELDQGKFELPDDIVSESETQADESLIRPDSEVVAEKPVITTPESRESAPAAEQTEVSTDQADGEPSSEVGQDVLSEDGQDQGFEQHPGEERSYQASDNLANAATTAGAERSAPNHVAAGVDSVTATTEPSASKSDSATPTDPEPLTTDKLMQQVKLNVRTNSSRINFLVDPPELGRLNIQLVMRRGRLTGEITTESEVVEKVLQSGLDALKETMRSAGIHVDSLNVKTGAEGNQEQPQWFAASDDRRGGQSSSNRERRGAEAGPAGQGSAESKTKHDAAEEGGINLIA